ncbi:MAG TPA: MGMT family protein [Candidatus Binatia bacterium]|nr:MGMT family protein [Candidatus Binatia bacterium]
MGTGRAERQPLTFTVQVWRLVRRIPPGRVATYGQIAALVGRPGAARAVGRAMRECPADVPWHRVVNARGGISARPRASGMVTQRLRLEAEGVRFERGLVRLGRYRWPGPGRRDATGAASFLFRADFPA